MPAPHPFILDATMAAYGVRDINKRNLIWRAASFYSLCLAEPIKTFERDAQAQRAVACFVAETVQEILSSPEQRTLAEIYSLNRIDFSGLWREFFNPEEGRGNWDELLDAFGASADEAVVARVHEGDLTYDKFKSFANFLCYGLCSAAVAAYIVHHSPEVKSARPREIKRTVLNARSYLSYHRLAEMASL